MPAPRTAEGRRGGFTLVELLMVVIVLSILAAVVVPFFGGAGEDAKASALQASLARLRGAIERYRAEHDGRVPGAVLASDGVTPSPTPGACQAAAVAQLTRYTSAAGAASGTRGAAFPLGPYLKDGALPANPFLSGETADDLTCERATADLTAAPTANGASGWKLYVLTARLVSNDATVLDDGRSTLDF